MSLAANGEATAAGAIIRYNIDRYPAGSLSCQDAARTISNRFVQVTGKEVEATDCQRSRRGTYAIDVFYISNERLRLESTWASSLGPEGSYQTFEECRGEISEKVEQFERATGLPPVVAYCFEEDYADNSSHRVVMGIDGLGSARRHYFQKEILLGAGGAPVSDNFISGVVEGMRNLGADVFKAFVRTDSSRLVKLSLQYFHEIPVNLNYSMPSLYESNNDCESQREAAMASFRAAGQPALSSTCINDSGGVVKMWLVHLFNPGVELEVFPEGFSARTACEENVGRIVENARLKLGWDLPAGFCGGWTGNWRVMGYRRVGENGPVFKTDQ